MKQDWADEKIRENDGEKTNTTILKMRLRSMFQIRWAFCLLTTCLFVNYAGPACALDRFVVRESGKKVSYEGRVIERDTGGNVVLEERDGRWRVLQAKDMLEQTSDDVAFEPYTHEELKKRLKAEFPKEFRIVETQRYVIVFDTTIAYAKWCGELLEQLDTAFLEHWREKGFELTEPEFPLVAVIFADRGNFVRCTAPEVGPAVTQINAYFSQDSNRIVFYDLTGLEVYGGVRGTTNKRIREIMSRPDSAKAVSTFVHEATHQISYNCGLLQRHSACPIWVSEGIATLYETPDFNSVKAWSSDLKVNQLRLNHFYRYIVERNPQEPAKQLVESDEPFQLASNTMLLDAYATCWTMTHFLNAEYGDKLVEYLKVISEKKPFLRDDKETRLRDFESVFGKDWDELHRTLFLYAGSLGKD